MTFQKKTHAPAASVEEEIEDAAPVATEPLPHRFVLLEGCERSFVLVQEEEQVLRDGRVYTTPGIRISGRPIPGVKGIRIVDLETAPYCTRAQNRFTPDRVAALIMANKRYTGDYGPNDRFIEHLNPVILSYPEWQDSLAFEKNLAADSKKRAEEYAAEQRAKRGKRGFAPASV